MTEIKFSSYASNLNAGGVSESLGDDHHNIVLLQIVALTRYKGHHFLTGTEAYQHTSEKKKTPLGWKNTQFN